MRRGPSSRLLAATAVRVQALALDYDGTLAFDGQIAPDTVAALEQARAASTRLILATGRAFGELTRLCERLDVFDAVVAENGAVLSFPATGVISDLALPPPPRFLAELDRRGIDYHAGRVIVGTSRTEEDRVCDAMASAGVSLERIYNRDSLMLLPAGVSKGTGVQYVLPRLGLAPHDVLAIGDSENDVELFRACGWRACPGNAIPQLAEQADWVFPGSNGPSVARAIRETILTGRLGGR